MPPLFMVGTLVFTLATPSARATSGPRVSSSGHAGGASGAQKKPENMGSVRPSLRGMHGALVFREGNARMKEKQRARMPSAFFPVWQLRYSSSLPMRTVTV